MINLVETEDGSQMVSSRDIADHFGKSHKHVLDSSRKLIRDLESDGRNFGRENFQESTYITERGKTYQNILMSKDGFSLLAMAFNGTKALEWKIKYLEAFNKMESYINKDSSDLTLMESINNVSKQLDNLADAGSSWGRTGTEIKRRKREATQELEVLIASAQLRLGI